jgi:C4-dicarboxylate transporter DctM subunit
MAVGLAIGMATPPVAIDIYVASAITGLSLEEISKPIIPMIVSLILVFLLVTYFPMLSLFLPKLVYGSI